MNWITFRSLHPHDPEIDTGISVPVENIGHIIAATNKDRQQRKEMQAIVMIVGGHAYGTDNTPEELLEKITNATR